MTASKFSFSWENPFGNREQTAFAPLGRKTLLRHHGADLDSIRHEQQRLRPFFETLAETAAEMLDQADRAARMTSNVNVAYKVLYRLPDQPDFLQTFMHETSDNVVILSERGEKSHPLVEQLFPLRRFDDLPGDAQTALSQVVQITLRVKHLNERDLPHHVRMVYPRTLNQITHWLENIEGPINDFRYEVRPTAQDSMRHAKHDVTLN